MLCFLLALPLPPPLSVPLPHRGSFAEDFSFLSSKAGLRDFLSYNSSILCRIVCSAGIHLFPFRAWAGRLIIIDTTVQVPVSYSGPGFVHSYPPLPYGTV
jgi:hypothetical protein